ncbi:hypothetical protein [Apilactobacillus xinyiensis]|uniref:hypothetical protein n=1 Tax=Apilactobacillus xinyiensis TaxID=2841032 RepID=UPI00200DE4AB|nr:hypothetical protein [Apilactobacillus xinyiensis]MCL0318599.1 hypothetical protein [Apilactobacillus xinyiensis]
MENYADFDESYFKKLKLENSYKSNDEQMEKFWDVLKDQLMSNVISSFQITQILDQFKILGEYKKGGDISTVHNAENNVFVDEEHKKRYKKSFNRKDYEGIGDSSLSKQRKRIFQENRIVLDEYTGKKLPKNGTANLDHVTSAKEIHENKKAKLFLTDKERNKMATNKHNMALTDERLNKSKGAKDAKEWEHEPGKKEKYDLDFNKIDKKYNESHKYINRKVAEAQFKEYASVSIKSGLRQGAREAIGILLYYGTNIFISELKQYIKTWKIKSSFSKRIDDLKKSVIDLKSKLFNKYMDIKNIFKDVFAKFSLGFIGGIISSIFTAIINNFVTTIPRVGKIIKDSCVSFCHAAKLFFTNPDRLNKYSLFKKVMKIFSAGIALSVGEVISNMIKDSLSMLPFSSEISDFVGILISGLISAGLIYVIDRLKKIFDSFKAVVRKVLGKSKKQIIDEYNKIIKKMDDFYRPFFTSLVEYYDRLNKLADLAYDMHISTKTKFKGSIMYAKASGVSDDDTLHNMSEIDKYFLN